MVPQYPFAIEVAIAKAQATVPNTLQEGCTPVALLVFVYIDSKFIPCLLLV